MLPLGVIVPFTPAVAVIVYVSAGITSNVAEIVWLAVTSENVYVLCEPTL